MARAAVEAVLCSLADGIDNLAACGITPERVVLIGGAARSPAVRSIAPAVFGVPVTVPDPAEYVAIGAARQAAWALSGAAEPPAWPGSPAATFTADPRPEIRDRYATLRDDTVTWHERNRRES
jgi:xylulokinase